MKFKKARWLAVAAAAILAVGACGNAGETDDAGSDVKAEDVTFDEGTRMAELNKDGKVKIGVKFDQPGVGFKPAGASTPSGFDIEVGKILAAKLGLETSQIEWVETVSNNREPFLQNGTVDFVIASYSITEDRRKIVGQAGPYYVTGQSLLVQESDNSINGPNDLSGKKVCSVTGSTSIKTVEEEFGATPAGFQTYSECVDQLLNGSVDAVTTDGVILLGYAADHEGKLKVVGEPFSEERYGIGFDKSKPELCGFINESLTSAFEDGSWAKAFDATLGKGGSEAGDPPALDPCA